MLHRVALDPRVGYTYKQEHEGRCHIVLLWTDGTNIPDYKCRKGISHTVSFWFDETAASSLEVVAECVTPCCFESKDGCRLQKKHHEKRHHTVLFCIDVTFDLLTETHGRVSHRVALDGWCGGEERLGGWG